MIKVKITRHAFHGHRITCTAALATSTNIPKSWSVSSCTIEMGSAGYGEKIKFFLLRPHWSTGDDPLGCVWSD